MERFTVSLITEATGNVTKGLKIPVKIPGEHSIDYLQETIVLGTLHIIRRVLQCET